MLKLEKEIFRNKLLMRFNVGLTLNEQTEIESNTITITPHMFDSLLTNERYRPLIDEGIQGELDKVRSKELNNISFGTVGDHITKPRPQQVDLNPFAKGATDLPCPACKAYDAIEKAPLSAGISSITLKDIKDQIVKLGCVGWVAIGDYKLIFRGTLRAKFSLKEDILYYSLEDVNISADIELSLYPFKAKFKYSKIKITNDFWCGGTCWSFDPGIEDDIKKKFGTRTLNIGPLYDPAKKINEE